MNEPLVIKESDVTPEDIEKRLKPIRCEICVHADKDIRTSRLCCQCLMSKDPYPAFKQSKRRK